jgi:hypothetical protein
VHEGSTLPPSRDSTDQHRDIGFPRNRLGILRAGPYPTRGFAMATSRGSRAPGADHDVDSPSAGPGRAPARRLSTETKAAFKTTELAAYVAAVIAVLIAAAVVSGDGPGDPDGFVARQAWLYVTILTVGYMVSRGLAKSGSREPYDADRA